ncbi:hypothetical protein [uncultured Thomasclavelia sp.]|uniref:beta-sandwich lipoprotein n=1 Tax=uncultured Thomasclavelia sp. TaxID=3025759 RepID=UPI0025986AF7|nr:hypothetical protein [uncultured Thomasclavelia sp.]
MKEIIKEPWRNIQKIARKLINYRILDIMALLLIVLSLSGCTDAEVASQNISKEADQFRVKRRITFINLRTDSYLFSITGNCSINSDNSHNELEVVCKVGNNKYQKHFLKLTTEVTYVAEQLKYSEVSKYDYEIVFKPESIIPIKLSVE